MPSVEVSLPEHIRGEIDRLVEQGDFINREQAFEELLTMGVSAHETTQSEGEQPAEDLFTQAVEDQKDPAVRNDPDDEDYTF